ncbi:MAG: TlpA disulfide reductase family protein [Saprospiraceae bacterium]
MKSLLLTTSLVLLIMSNLIAQNNSPGFASSSNANKAQSQFEGIQSMPFQAFDMNGNTHFLPEYKGKVVVIAFWATGDETSRQQIKSLNRVKREFSSQEVAIISFAEEDKSDLVSFLKNNKIEYPVIPNSKPLGEIGYGGDLGTSRIFILDKKGMVQKVIIAENEEEMGAYKIMKPIITDLMR